ncbi:MAG TPA: PilZ domain-containing protein [Candidatus Eisenbacteria bacterium]|nr:PilZ domain-containing protein [Candidatus Eisenbacteria bacterium]
MSEEKRRFFRHPIHAPLSLHLDAETDAPSEALDLSLGGLSFLWSSRLAKGHLIRVSIAVKEKLFDVKGRVAYSVEDRKTGKFRSGISFVDSPSAFRAKLAEEALEILRYRSELSRELEREVSEDEAAHRWIQQNAARFPYLS